MGFIFKMIDFNLQWVYFGRFESYDEEDGRDIYVKSEQNDELCVKNEEFCIKNDEFCRPFAYG